MALFSKQVAVNVDDVIRFRQGVDTFAQVAYTTGDDLVNSLIEMEDFARQNANNLENIASSYDRLYSSIKQLEQSVEHRIAVLKTQIGNTPKELEEKSADGEGNVKVKRTPNPEYKTLEAEIQKEKSKLFAIKELSWKVYNEVSYSHRTANELASSANELKKLIPDLQRNARDAVLKSEGALRSLENSIQAINAYITFNFRV